MVNKMRGIKRDGPPCQPPKWSLAGHRRLATPRAGVHFVRPWCAPLAHNCLWPRRPLVPLPVSTTHLPTPNEMTGQNRRLSTDSLLSFHASRVVFNWAQRIGWDYPSPPFLANASSLGHTFCAQLELVLYYIKCPNPHV